MKLASSICLAALMQPSVGQHASEEYAVGFKYIGDGFCLDNDLEFFAYFEVDVANAQACFDLCKNKYWCIGINFSFPNCELNTSNYVCNLKDPTADIPPEFRPGCNSNICSSECSVAAFEPMSGFQCWKKMPIDVPSASPCG
eukprot:CAMPEP_0197823056 /NCGR_PEP_ID=MMETSP1437-20131217/375_1 /TAXON_ID=49252 ORGANISM="Eucampia antarctica, Strain CCMP1452" /NCGR_SAMPLE_ID=MMETSP1437 /ASSEMBLY_ACC=CAM_ASM_001096 /LENGTH=141 /DNA_ID=CAMNT_0043422011 /DNA_START=93 /DNA_END=518 /DNA_ORIENTATION=-